MDSPSQGIRVTIFGDEYSLKGDVDAETTRQVAAYVDRKILELQGKSASRDKLKIAILSALNIAGELFDHKSKAEQQEKQLTEVGKKAEALSEKLDEVLFRDQHGSCPGQ